MYGRHHAIQECLLSLCRSAGVPARKEVLIDASNSRPADVFLPGWHRGVSCAVDVTVTHPSQSNLTVCDGVSERPSASVRAAEAKARQTNTKYSAQCEAQGFSFAAAAVCCFGGWLPDGEHIVETLAERAGYRSGTPVLLVKAVLTEIEHRALERQCSSNSALLIFF